MYSKFFYCMCQVCWDVFWPWGFIMFHFLQVITLLHPSVLLVHHCYTVWHRLISVTFVEFPNVFWPSCHNFVLLSDDLSILWIYTSCWWAWLLATQLVYLMHVLCILSISSHSLVNNSYLVRSQFCVISLSNFMYLFTLFLFSLPCFISSSISLVIRFCFAYCWNGGVVLFAADVMMLSICSSGWNLFLTSTVYTSLICGSDFSNCTLSLGRLFLFRSFLSFSWIFDMTGLWSLYRT